MTVTNSNTQVPAQLAFFFFLTNLQFQNPLSLYDVVLRAIT